MNNVVLEKLLADLLGSAPSRGEENPIVRIEESEQAGALVFTLKDGNIQGMSTCAEFTAERALNELEELGKFLNRFNADPIEVYEAARARGKDWKVIYEA